jgi:hypothetical protein
MKKTVGNMSVDEFDASVRKVVYEIVDKVVEQKIKEIRPPWVDQMLELLDASAGNYKKVDEAQVILTGKQSEQSDQLDNHEHRLEKIEKHIFKN